MKRFVHALLAATFLVLAAFAAITAFLFVRQARESDSAHLTPLRCAGTQPLPGEPLRGRVVWYFDRPLAPLADADARDVLGITPPLAGRVSAEGSHLIFTPADKPAFGAIYQIELGGLIRGANGAPLDAAARHHVFPAFTFRADQPWLLERNGEGVVLALRFPAPVDPAALQSALTITDGANRALALSVAPGAEERTYRVTLDGEHTPPYRLALAEGLAEASGQVRLREAQTFTFDPAASQKVEESNSTPTPLAINWHNLQPAGREGVRLEMALTWPVEAADLDAHLTITPPIGNRRVEQRYGYTFHISGEWASKMTYQIVFEPGLREHASDGGQTLAAPLRLAITTPAAPTHLGFADEGQMFFPRRPGAALTLESRNTARARLRLARLFPSNLPVALEDIRRQRVRDDFSAEWCEEISETTIALPAGRDRLHETPLTLDGLLPPDASGIYYLHASTAAAPSGENEWGWWDSQDSSAKLILATNLGVVAHWTARELVLFAHDLASLDPASSASVSLYSSKNQLLAAGRTGTDGLLHLRDLDGRLGEPKVAVIEQGGDFTFLDLSERPEDQQGISSAWPNYEMRPYEAFLYAARDLIRPGEQLPVRWIVSGPRGESAAGVPLLFRVLKPDGRPLEQSPVTLSEFGSGGRDVETLAAHPTGVWRAQLLVPGDDAPVGEYVFHVEEFVPNRLKAAVTLEAAIWTGSEKQRLTVHGEHLTGAPAAGRKAEASVRLTAEPDFAFEQWPGFRFGNEDAPKPETDSLGEAVLGLDGEARFTFEAKAAAPAGASEGGAARWTSPVRATVIGRVMELGGRAVTAKTEVMLFPSAVCLGIAAAPAPEPGVITVEAAAVSPDGAPAVLDEVEITLERKTWRYNLRHYRGHNEPAWANDFEAIETRRVPVRDGRARAAFAVERWGGYRVRSHSPATPQFSTVSFFSSDGVCRVADPARPALLRIALDGAPVAIGGEARVRLEAPFDGKALVVVQNEAIREARVVTLVNQSAEFTIPIRAEHLPNAWIEATLIHGLEREHGRAFPFSSFASALLRVEDPARRIEAVFESLPAETSPGAPAAITVRLHDTAGRPVVGEVTLAAVDEGVHAVTNYANPDPRAWLGRARRPDLRRAHYYDRVAYDFDKPLPGGDGPSERGAGADAAARLADANPTWIAPVALWSGVVRADAEGRAVITLPVPDYTGRLRLVAVAAGADGAMGAAAAGVFVRRPYDLEIALPRVLLPGDAAQPVAQLRNDTDAPVTAALEWEFAGALEAATSARALEIAPHAAVTLPLSLTAGAAAGAGRIHWTAVFQGANGGELFTLERDTPLPVLHPLTFESRPFFRVLPPGGELALDAAEFLAMPDPEIHLTAGANPLLRLQGALALLVAYPYGCVEQTTSRLMPMFVLRRHEALTRTALGPEAAPLHEYLQAGIDRLFAMQTASGGLGYWPGAGAPSEYGSVYALHFLTLAQGDAGLRLPAENLKALKDYVRRIVLDASAVPGVSDVAGHSTLYTRAYAVFVLSLDGDLEAIQQIERFEGQTLPRPARLLLAAALAAQTPASERVARFLAGPADEYRVAEPDAALASDPRNKAVEFMALTRLPGMAPEDLAARAMELMNWLEAERFGSTQEQAFVATALAGYLEGLEANVDSAGAAITTGSESADIKGADMFERRLRASAGPVTIRNTGAAPIFVSAAISGVPHEADTSPLSAGLTLTRTLFNERGDALNSGEFEQGQTCIVTLTVMCPESRRDVLVVDRLPAGFEVENTRLDPELAPEAGLPSSIAPAMLELRDDRVIAAFDRLDKGTHLFHYVARAVTPGRFAHPAAQAECMYQPAVRARTAAGAVTIRESAADPAQPPVAAVPSSSVPGR